MQDLVRTRAHVTKFIEMRSHLQSCGLKLQTVKSHQAMGEAMKNTTKAMVCRNTKSLKNMHKKLGTDYKAVRHPVDKTLLK